MAVLLLNVCIGSAIRTHQHRPTSGRAMIGLTRTKSCPARHGSCSPLELSPSTRLTRLCSIFRRPSGKLNRLRSTCRRPHRRKARQINYAPSFLLNPGTRNTVTPAAAGRGASASAERVDGGQSTSDPARGSSGATPRPGRRSGDFDQRIVVRNDCETFSHHASDNRVPWVVSRCLAARTRPAT